MFCQFSASAEIYSGTIVTIGTSITCGHKFHDPDHSMYDGSEDYWHQYPAWVDYYMNSRYSVETNISVNCTNISWDRWNFGCGSGYSPMDLLDNRLAGTDTSFNSNCQGWRIPSPASIDIVIVEGGHHDINIQGNTPQQLNMDTWALYNYTSANGIKMVLCAVTPDYRSVMHSAATVCNNWRLNLSNNKSDVWFADVFNTVLYDSGDNDWCDESYYCEGEGSEVHPNKAGYMAMASVITDALYNATVYTTITTPVGYNDYYSVKEDGVLLVPEPGVLENDTDAEGGPLSAIKVSDPSNGVLTLNSNGSFAYTPNPDYSGSDSFTYKANNSMSDSNIATVYITINAENNQPTANFTFIPSSPTGLDVIQFTDTSTDIDGYVESWYWEFDDGNTSTLQNPTHQYANQGTYTVTLNVTDDGGAANETTKQIFVANIAPLANNDCYSVTENCTLNISAPGVLGNDTNADGDPLNTSLISTVSNGVLTLFDNGSFSYTPTVGYSGTDSFTYKAFDGIDYSNEATVTIWIIPNHPPYTSSNPLPSDGKTNVDKNKILSWSGGDPDYGDTVTYDVYFGTSNPPLKMSSNQSGTSYDPGTMSYNTKQYWKIIAWDNNGTSAEGPIWSFTTEKKSTHYNPPYNPPLTNQDPIANTSASETLGFINTTVIFDGSLSSDEDGNITNYTWNFGDETTGYGEVTTHAYAHPDEYIVTLTVTDNKGATDDDTLTVIISKPNIPPTIPEVDGTSSGTQNTDYIYSAVSTDADNDTIQYQFDWGDGEMTTTGYLPNGTLTTQTHSWVTAGKYIISIKAYDNETEAGTSEYIVLIDVWLIDDEIKGYLVDEDGDEIYDSFHNETSDKNLDVCYVDGKYLIDDDGDGNWNYVYDSDTFTITEYHQSEKESILGIDNALLNSLVIGLFFSIIILIIVFFIYRKKGKSGNKSKRGYTKKPKQSSNKKKGKK